VRFFAETLSLEVLFRDKEVRELIHAYGQRDDGPVGLVVDCRLEIPGLRGALAANRLRHLRARAPQAVSGDLGLVC
jgi:hypothetical protein